MRARNRITTLQIKHAAPGKYADGGGLWLHVRKDGGSQWFLRFTIHGRRREMGLGSTTDVSLKEARAEADKWRSVVFQGRDPIKERERQRREAAKDENTLRKVATAAFDARKAELKDDGKSGRWFSPLELHILPKLGKVPVEEIDQNDIRNALAPIWHSKGETARKAINRLGIVLRHAAAMGLCVDLQATEKAKQLLGKSRQQTHNIPALPWQDVPAFYASLERDTLTELALKLLILTATRSGSLRLAQWTQFQDDVWTIPAANMKGAKGKTREFRVPLCNEAMSILEKLRFFTRDNFVFPGARKGIISDMTMTNYLKDRGYEFRPHGFRSSFRTWCAEATNTPREIAEAALSHVSGSKVELSYRRTDFLERRRSLMEGWAEFVTGDQRKELSITDRHGKR